MRWLLRRCPKHREIEPSDCGLYGIEDMRPINELRMRARWKLGRGAEAQAERVQSAERSSDTWYGPYQCSSDGATECARSCEAAHHRNPAHRRVLPEDELPKAFAEWPERGRAAAALQRS